MDNEHDPERDEAARPASSGLKKKKKKKKRRVAAAEPASERPRARRVESAAVAAMQWTGNHVAIALVAGVAIGAAGGYFVAKGGSQGAGKDDAQAMGSGRPGMDARGAQQQQAPVGRVFVPLAAYSARRGPEHAKVTILDFSDFQ
jgi:hypothetical protein